MKNKILLQCIIVTCLAISFKTLAQNADEMIFNQYLPQYNYVVGSFVIDTGISVTNQKRAFLIWANNLNQDSLKRYFSLSEYDGNLNFLTEQGNSAKKFGSLKNMFPKKIIKSKFEHAYYLLAYTINSKHTTGGFNVYSSPVVFKIDGNLNLVWASKINLAALTANNLKTVIEYNDMIETRDKNIVLVGKYADNTSAKESILATKLKGASGALVWQYVYKTPAQCNEAANSVAETTNGNLSIAGYIKKCVPGQGFNGNADLLYVQLQPTGIPVPGIYERFFWPSNLNIWGDKITCYTSAAGQDQLIISGYIDVQTQTGVTDRQILVMNLKENGLLVTAQHIGNTKTDVCNDLIFKKSGSTANDFLIYLTGQTGNSPAQVYYLSAKFNAATGVTAITEVSTFPNTTYSLGNRNGVEIKNAGSYKKFAILATGTYQPVANSFQTYSDVLIRDLNDTTNNCIKIQKMPLQQFNLDRTFSTADVNIPQFKIYGEKWQKLPGLFVKEQCQQIVVDPSKALNIMQDKGQSTSIQLLSVNPNPANSMITISTSDGLKLTGNYKTATLQVYNYAMQAEKMINISSLQGSSVQLPVGQLKAGVYWIQLTRGNEKLSCSFIKE